jgi:hypothetical protein
LTNTIPLLIDDSVHCQHLSDALGNGAIVETSDKKIIVLQRSYNVADYPGYYVFPGGHSEVNSSRLLDNTSADDESKDLCRYLMYNLVFLELIEKCSTRCNIVSLMLQNKDDNNITAGCSTVGSSGFFCQ